MSLLVGSSAFANCASDADCSNHGRCDLEIEVCSCDSGYTDKTCDYEQYQQITAFLLHLFFGIEFGAGDFYIRDFENAVIKLALFWTSLVLLGCGHTADTRSEFGLGFGLGFIGFVSAIVWWIFDIVNFGRNTMEDGKNKPLESW